MAHWTGRYVQEVDHAAADVQAEALSFEGFVWEGGGRKKGRGEEENYISELCA